MKKIVIFAGTTEGRRLSEILADAGIAHTVCVATEYGEIVMREQTDAEAARTKEQPFVSLHRGRMDREQMEEFFQWLDGRDIIPRIQEIREDAVQDLNLRIEKILRKTPMQEEDRINLLEAVDTAAGKVVNKMIFGLRDSLNQDAFLECVAGLEKVYEE